MQNTKFFIAAGALALAVASVFTTKADKKFAPVSSAKLPGISATTLAVSSTHFTDVKGLAGKTVFLRTVGNSILSTLKTATNGAANVYFH